MLSVRLSPSLENKLAEFCALQNVSKSVVVQSALEKHLRRVISKSAKPVQATKEVNPFDAFRGIGNQQFNTDQIMQMTRGEDWRTVIV